MRIKTSMSLKSCENYDKVTGTICLTSQNDIKENLQINHIHEVSQRPVHQYTFKDIYRNQYEWKKKFQRSRTDTSIYSIYSCEFVIRVLILTCLISSKTAICQVMDYKNIYNAPSSSNYCEALAISRDFDLSPGLFCDHYHASALFPMWFEWKKRDEVVYKNCYNHLGQVLQHDQNATILYDSFFNMMKQYSTPDDYSFQWDQQQCKYSYKLWICSYFHIIYKTNGTVIEPCGDFCNKVEKSCPFFRIFNKTKLYGGQSTFLCSGIGTRTQFQENCYNMTHSSLKPLSMDLKPASCKVKKKKECACYKAKSDMSSGNKTSFSLKSIRSNGSYLNTGCESCSNNSNSVTFSRLYLLIAILSFLMNICWG